MEAEKPDIQVGCQLSNEQLASRITLLETVAQKVLLHIDKLRKEVDAIKRERDFYKDTFVRIFSGLPIKNDSPTEEDLQEISLPETLNTKEAHILWGKLKAAKLIDDHYQPLVSTAKAAMIANAMGIRLYINVRNRWKDFQLIWGRLYMSSDFIRAQKSDFFESFSKDIEKVLDS